MNSLTSLSLKYKCFMKTRIDSLFFLKGICAILVVFVHTDFFYRNLFVPISRLAVPLFFMISGYFMINSDGTFKDKLYIKKQMKKIGKYILISSFVYALYNIFNKIFLLNQVFSWELIFDKPLDKYFLSYLFLYSVFSGPLWYLTAYFQSLIFVPCLNKLSSKGIFLIIVLTYILGLLLGKYLWVWTQIDLPAPLMRNVLTMAVPFLFLGILIRKEEKFFVFLYKKYLYVFLFFIPLNYLEYWGILKWGSVVGGDYVVTTIFVLVFVFVYAISHPWLGRNSYLGFIGEKLSLDIYLYHSIFVSLFYWVNHKYDLFIDQLSFPIVLLSVYLLALCVMKTKSFFKEAK